MTELLAMPINEAAEWSVLSHMLTKPAVIGEVIGLPLEQRDFSSAAARLVFASTVERFYSSQPVDALIVGDLLRDDLAAAFGVEDSTQAGPLLVQKVREAYTGSSVLSHAEIVRKLSTARQLQEVCWHALTAINEGRLTPEEIGDTLSTEVLNVTAGKVARTELRDWMDTGREYVTQLQRVMAAREQGIEIGVYTGLKFIDNYTTGIGPGELCFLAGDPGVGKTAVAWSAAQGFAARQLTRPEDKRVGTLMLSLEMNLYASTMRMVVSLTGIDGTRLREGAVGKAEYQHILREWKNRENLPMYFNFASNFRLSQMRALIAEAIRRHNVGFVVIDHFRMIDTDRRYTNPNQEDEAKVRFLKENIAKDLNVAVMCLAHTVKVGRGQGGESPKPRLSDLRGSGQIAAHADFVAFLYDPNKYSGDDAMELMEVDEHRKEIAWEKNRFGSVATTDYQFEASIMRVADPKYQLQSGAV